MIVVQHLLNEVQVVTFHFRVFLESVAECFKPFVSVSSVIG